MLGPDLDDAVEQIAGAQTLRRRNGDRIAQAELVELVGERQVLHRVDLVGGDDHRDRDLAQQVGHVEVARADTGPGVDHQHGDVGFGQRLTRLLLDLPGQVVALIQVDTAGVDQRQGTPVPLGVELLAVACDARKLVHDRLPRLGEAVDQRRLADVRVSDDCDLHGRSSLACARHESDDRVDHLLERQPRRVELDGAVGRPQRRIRARRGRARRGSSARPAPSAWSTPSSRGPAARTLSRMGGQEHLEFGAGRDDGADVAALGDPIAVAHQPPLLRDHRATHPRVGGRLGRTL